MTAKERACFEAIFLWRRRYLSKTLAEALTPRLPTYLKAAEQGMSERVARACSDLRSQGQSLFGQI